MVSDKDTHDSDWDHVYAQVYDLLCQGLVQLVLPNSLITDRLITVNICQALLSVQLKRLYMSAVSYIKAQVN